MMGILRMLIAIWTGKAYKEEVKHSQETVEEARRVVRDTKAALDGEEFWLIPQRKDSCNGSNES